MEELADHLKKGLKIIFIGFNPGIKSSETGHHYAHPTNRFYKLLYESGLTPRLYKPAEDYKLLKLGYGLTNIVQRPTKSADGIKREEYEEGRKELIEKLKKYHPEVACFTGIGVYKEFAQKSKVKRGLQPKSYIEGVKEFVISSPSGLNRTPYKKQFEMYRRLKELIE